MIERGWQPWLRELFNRYFADASGQPIPFGQHHVEFWDWVWSIEKGKRPRPFVAIWPRGGGKSTAAELACVALAARKVRRYGLYICATQEQADDHVGNIGGMLESAPVESHYPDLASRMLGKYGTSKGWRRNRLRTAAGFTVDALGLDSAARGVKLDEQRPDFLVFDDVDSEQDSLPTVDKKQVTLTTALLPAGSEDLAVLGVQNLVHPDSIFSRLADGRADYLSDRIVSGPHPALQDLAYEQRDEAWVLVAGDPIWEGQSRTRCQEKVKDMGLTAFLRECQHEVEAAQGGMFDHIVFRHCAWDALPPLVRIVVWVDPAVTDNDESDSHGIQADGIAADNTIYRLWSWEGRTSPEDSLKRAILKAVELKAEAVGIETDQGGDLWRTTYNAICKQLQESGAIGKQTRLPQFRFAKAGAGHGPKAHRASLMLTEYERGRIVHCLGTHATLEKALKRFPKRKPFDLVDAAYWAWYDVARPPAKVRSVSVVLG